MPDFQLTAKAQYTPRSDLGQFVSTRVTPGAVAGAKASAQFVYDESQILVPVDKGDLKASGKIEVKETDKSVVASVVYTSEHAGFNEYGTGLRGAASPDPGPYPYSPTWPGMTAHPFLRPALDSARSVIRSIFASAISLTLKK